MKRTERIEESTTERRKRAGAIVQKHISYAGALLWTRVAVVDSRVEPSEARARQRI